MGRNRTFVDTKILAGTAQLFRRRGFFETSLKDLERDTGLQAGSLYHAFGNKRNVFLKSLDAYETSVVRWRIKTFLKGTDPLKELIQFFRSTYRVEGIPNPGCLLTNTAAQIGADDPDVQRKVEIGFSILRDAFASEIRLAQARRLASTDLSPELAAEFLLTAYQGLLVRVRQGAAAKVLNEIVRMTVGALSPTPHLSQKNRKG
jgi:AcrR family transcriptional regulator